MIDLTKIRDLIVSYRSQAEAPSLTLELRRYNEEMADYLGEVAEMVDRAQARELERRDDLDIRRAAKSVIDQHGNDASGYALSRSQQLFADGDAEGAAAWRLILKAIVELQQERRPDEASPKR